MGCACTKEVVELPQPEPQFNRIELTCTTLTLNHRSYKTAEHAAGNNVVNPVALWVKQTKVDPRLDPSQLYRVPSKKEKKALEKAKQPTSNLFDDEFDHFCTHSASATPRNRSIESDDFAGDRVESNSSEGRERSAPRVVHASRPQA